MSGWQSNVSDYSAVDNSQEYGFGFQQTSTNFYDDGTHYYGEDQTQYASHDPSSGAMPPPPKAARSDYDQPPYGSMPSYAGSSGYAEPRVNNVGGLGQLAAAPMPAGAVDPYAEGQYSHYSQSVPQAVGSSSYHQYQPQQQVDHHQQQQEQQQQQAPSYTMGEDWAENRDYLSDNYYQPQEQPQGVVVDSYDAYQSQSFWPQPGGADACDTSDGRYLASQSVDAYGAGSQGIDDTSASASASPFVAGPDCYRAYESISSAGGSEGYSYSEWSNVAEAYRDAGPGASALRRQPPTAASSSPSFFSRQPPQQQYEQQLYQPTPQAPAPHHQQQQQQAESIVPTGFAANRRSNFGDYGDFGDYSDFGGTPMNRIMRHGGGGGRAGGPMRRRGHGAMGPLNAIRGGPANFVSGGGRRGRRGPVSLMDATFAPPAGLPMLMKREKSIARWARAVRQEWPEHERRMRETEAAEREQQEQQEQQREPPVPVQEEDEEAQRGSLQVTSFLSDVLQRELRKNMTFLYGSLRDVAFGDRGGRGEFYPRDAPETTVIVDLCYDDVFVAQGCGSQRFEARENASQKALDLFLRDRVYVVGCYRLWEGEQIPGFCVSNSRHSTDRLPPYPRNPKRERGISEKPDSKTLPWLQVNPSSKMDTSSRLKPKSMKDFFILINGRGDDYSESEEKFYKFSAGFPKSLNAVAVVNNSAQFNQMKVEYRMNNRAMDGSQPRQQHCTILMDQQEVGEGEGMDPAQARRSACENVLERLSTTQPVVRMQLDRAETVSRGELDGWARRLADQDLAWVREMDAKLDPPNPMKEPHLQRIMDDAEAYLKQYIHDERQEPLKFGAEFTHDERMAIHKAARRLGLASKPYGPQWRLYQVVSLRFSLVELKRILLERGVAGRYALVERGSADMSHLWEQEEESEKQKEVETKGKEDVEAAKPANGDPSADAAKKEDS